MAETTVVLLCVAEGQTDEWLRLTNLSAVEPGN